MNCLCSVMPFSLPRESGFQKLVTNQNQKLLSISSFYLLTLLHSRDINIMYKHMVGRGMILSAGYFRQFSEDTNNIRYINTYIIHSVHKIYTSCIFLTVFFFLIFIDLCNLPSLTVFLPCPIFKMFLY